MIGFLLTLWTLLLATARATTVSAGVPALPPRCSERVVGSIEGRASRPEDEPSKTVWYIVGVSYLLEGRDRRVDPNETWYWDQEGLAGALEARARGSVSLGDEKPTIIVTPGVPTGKAGAPDMSRRGVVDAETFYTCLDYALQRADTNDHFIFYFVGHGSAEEVPRLSSDPSNDVSIEQLLYLTEDVGADVKISRRDFRASTTPSMRQHPIQFGALRDYIMFHAYGGAHAGASSNQGQARRQCPGVNEPLFAKGRFASVTFILDTCRVEKGALAASSPIPTDHYRDIADPVLCSVWSPLQSRQGEEGSLEYSGMYGPALFLSSADRDKSAFQLETMNPVEYDVAKREDRPRTLFTAALVRVVEETKLELNVIEAFRHARDLLACWYHAGSSQGATCAEALPDSVSATGGTTVPQTPVELAWWPLDGRPGAVKETARYSESRDQRFVRALPRLTYGDLPRESPAASAKKLGLGPPLRYWWERPVGDQRWRSSPVPEHPLADPAQKGLYLHRAEYPRPARGPDDEAMASRTWLSFGPTTQLRTQPRPFQDARQVELSTTLTVVQNLGADAVVPQGAPGLAFSYYPSSKHLIGLTLGAQARYSRWGRIGTLGLEQTSEEGLFSVGTFPVLVALLELGPQIYLMRRVSEEGRSAPTFSLAAPLGAGLVLRDPPSEQSYYPPHMDWERSPALTVGLRGSLLLGAFSISLSPDLLLARESELLRTTPELTLSFGWTP